MRGRQGWREAGHPPVVVCFMGATRESRFELSTVRSVCGRPEILLGEIGYPFNGINTVSTCRGAMTRCSWTLIFSPTPGCCPPQQRISTHELAVDAKWLLELQVLHDVRAGSVQDL